ncbi:MAG TPA: ribose-phosphate pyrophosphokinase [Thermoanaerobaculia bacterium]|nr:ribose-phosphate pyrophosphokinase [Thermoanaerobaculia bacterium]
MTSHAFNYGDLKIFSGRAHPALAQEMCAYLQMPLGALTLYNFSDGEDYCQIDENVRGADVFVVQPTCSPVNDHMMELLILLDAFRRSSASRITAVLPYFGYARQDKKDKPRVPIAAKLMADLLTAAGADRILTMDLHAAQIQGFFNIPVDHLFAAPVILDAIRKLVPEELVIVSPDVGGLTRARAIAKRLDAALAVIDKRRTGKNETEILRVVGEVEGKDVLILDDIIDTAGTLVQAEAALRRQGARRTYAAAVHGVFSGPALERIEGSGLESLLVTNTIPVEAAMARCPRIKALSVAPLLGEAIKRIHDGASVSSLFV